MTNTKNNLTNNNIKPKRFQLSIPMNVDYLIGENESIRTLIEISERLDYSKLNASYKRLPKKEEATPKQMFQLVILGFMNGIYSTRKLESSSKHDIRFLCILQGKPAPDHNRFWSFIKHRLQGEVMENLFYQLNHYLKELGEIDLTNLFVDGTKIEANANRYSFVWKKSTNKFETRLDVKIEEKKEELLITYPFLIKADTTLKDCLFVLKEYAKTTDVIFVYSRGKKKTQIQRDIELLANYLERKTKYEGYNLQLGVDVNSERSDSLTLLPLLDRMESGIGERHKNIIADAGYESEENYKGLVEREQTA